MKVGVVGVGLIGGSIARALARHGVELYLDDADGETRRLLRESGLGQVSAYTEWAPQVDAVILSVPLPQMEQVVRGIAPLLQKGALLIDISSLKRPIAPILKWAGSYVRVMSWHLMAGREVSGFSASSADLFVQCAAAVVDIGTGFPEPETLQWWQEHLNTAPFSHWALSEHDAAIAWISHLPYLASRAVASVVQTHNPGSVELAGPGFQDTTRVGRSPVDPLLPLLHANAPELRRALAVLESELRTWREILAEAEHGTSTAAAKG